MSHFIKNIIAILFLVLLATSNIANANEFRILAVEGRVEISSDQSKWTRVSSPRDIKSGTWIKTGASGSATLVLPDKTQTRIAKNSELLLRGKKEKEGEVKLKLGKIWAKTNKKPVKIKIKAPNAVASIRGTEWVIEVSSSGQSSLAVMEGKIDIQSNTGSSESVEGGSLATIDQGGRVSVVTLVNPGEYLQFVYKYQVEPLAYLPLDLIKSDAEGDIIRGLGTGSENLVGAEKALAEKLIEGKFPQTFRGAPNDVYKLIRYAERKQYLSVTSYSNGSNWSAAWRDWLNAIKAECYLAIGDDKRASRQIRKITDLYTKELIRSKQLISKGSLDEARDMLQKLTEQYGNSASLYVTLGEAEQSAGRIQLARENYESAYKLAPQWYLPALRLSSVSLIQGRFDEAKRLIEEAKERNADSSSVLANYAEFYSLRNNLAGAEEALKFLMNEGSEDFQMVTAKGIIDLKRGESEKARDTFIDATALERNYSKAYSFLAVAHLHSGEPEIAFRQLDLASSLDPNDPLPHVIASQIYASLLMPEEAGIQAGLARDKSNGERSFGQLANDQQGGANVGRRFLEVGLPYHAREASVETRRVAWAGSYLFDAATARSGLERSSKYVMGFILDSQAFGTRRDVADIISRPGRYGYHEAEFRAGNNEQLDIKYKFGMNGREISDQREFSYLYDIGVYGAQRDAYYSPDGSDTSLAALGFFGAGWREDYDHNRFLTANFVPFRTDGTFPVQDNTLRIDFGDSMRKDSFTRIIRLGGELGDANIDLNVSTGCTGKDNQKTSKIELGYAEIGRDLPFGQFDWSVEGAYGTTKSDYVVSHPSAASCTDIESETYQNRDENIDSTEYDAVLTANLKSDTELGLFHLRYKGYIYNHDFKQTRVLDGVTQTPFNSDKDETILATSLGYSAKLGNSILRLGYIEDYHPISQVSMAVDDLAGIPSKFEFMKPGSEIEQISMHLATDLSSTTRAFIELDEFTIYNNPIYLLLREQWNSDLLDNFALDKYDNPNTEDLIDIDNGFGAAEIKKYSIAVERTFQDRFSLSAGYHSWDAQTIDHPRISDDTAGVRLSGLPENTSYLGLTVALSNDSVFSSRIWNNSSVYDGTTATSEDQQKYSVNYNFSGDDGKSQWTVGLNGDLSSASDSHLLSVNYRLYF